MRPAVDLLARTEILIGVLEHFVEVEGWSFDYTLRLITEVHEDYRKSP